LIAVSLRKRLTRPEYLWRPGAVARRLRLIREGRGDLGRFEAVALPWAQRITVFPDGLGRNIYATGIFDLCTTDAVHRLLDPGDLAMDVGANVGYFTNLMATRVGPEGAVIAFEPHPVVFELLQENVARWNADTRLGTIETRCLAVSNESGGGYLSANTSLAHMGIASMRDSANGVSDDDFEVETVRLDDFREHRRVGLLKLDVEGHEHAVLRGAVGMLEHRRVRDIVFEDFEVYPTPAMSLLESHGLTLFSLSHSLSGLCVRPIHEGPAEAGWPGRNYLATFDQERALQRLGPKGWACLRGA
jgi:FkbM family methyltransferase